jgi:hypothetical protein
MIWIVLAILIVGFLIVRAINEPEMRRKREEIRRLEEKNAEEAESAIRDFEIEGLKKLKKDK